MPWWVQNFLLRGGANLGQQEGATRPVHTHTPYHLCWDAIKSVILYMQAYIHVYFYFWGQSLGPESRRALTFQYGLHITPHITSLWALDGGGGGSPMSPVDFKKWQCPLSLF